LRWRRVVGYVSLGLLLVLMNGKILGLPVALLLVSGTSMVPALEPGDMVVAVSPGLAGGIHVGDIVVYCLGVALRTGCVIHRVVELRPGPGGLLVVTKGDAVPRPDPPVPASLVGYVVVARIPRVVVLLAALVAALWLFHRIYIGLPRRVHSGTVFVEPGIPALLMVAAYVAFNMLYVGLSYVDVTMFNVALPSVGENVTVNLTAYTAWVNVSYTAPLAPAGKPSCSLRGHGPAAVSFLEAGPGWLYYRVSLPERAFAEEWARLSREKPPLASYPARIEDLLFLDCRVPFNKAMLESSYPVRLYWTEPIARLEGHTLVIANNNPVPIAVNITVYPPRGYPILLHETLRVEPFTAHRLLLPPGDLVVRLVYRFAGHTRSLTLRAAPG